MRSARPWLWSHCLGEPAEPEFPCPGFKPRARNRAVGSREVPHVSTRGRQRASQKRPPGSVQLLQGTHSALLRASRCRRQAAGIQGPCSSACVGEAVDCVCCKTQRPPSPCHTHSLVGRGRLSKSRTMESGRDTWCMVVLQTPTPQSQGRFPNATSTLTFTYLKDRLIDRAGPDQARSEGLRPGTPTWHTGIRCCALTCWATWLIPHCAFNSIHSVGFFTQEFQPSQEPPIFKTSTK